MRRACRATPEYPDGLYVVELRHCDGPDCEWYLDETGDLFVTEAEAEESARKYVADWPEVKEVAGLSYDLEARVVQFRRDSWSAPMRSKAREST